MRGVVFRRPFASDNACLEAAFVTLTLNGHSKDVAPLRVMILRRPQPCRPQSSKVLEDISGTGFPGFVKPVSVNHFSACSISDGWTMPHSLPDEARPVRNLLKEVLSP
jgi:hypothetical protein